MDKTDKTDKINVGKIIGVHGIKGQVKVEVLTDNPARFACGSRLFCEKTGTCLTVEGASPHKEILLVKFAEVENRDMAEALASSYLQVDRKDVAPLPDGVYYYFQIEGLDVYTEGEYFGKVISVQATGANDIYNVKMTNGKIIALPALDWVIKKIDLEAGTMEVDIPEGLL
ncbi:MAG: 16S rRNA processing protein RimM [Peptococcaceae bacterium]|jgi:16S rRNA processing protein RimM|nr:16S rRNA processing protein RimM [Peptococcaceae bacterium]